MSTVVLCLNTKPARHSTRRRVIDPMSIVVDARLLAYNRSGIGRYLRHLYTALAGLMDSKQPGAVPAGLRLTMLYHRRDRERALAGRWPGVTAWTPPHHRLERWTLAAELARLRPRLVHAPDHVCPEPLGWRTVLTVHDLAFLRLPETHAPQSRAYYAGLFRSVRRAVRTICVSHATRDDLLELTGADPQTVRVIYEAPDPCYVPDGPAAPAERPYLVFTGTIEPRKNLARVLHALATLAPGRRPELRIAGAAGYRAAEVLALPAQLGIAGDVRFLGPRPTSEVAALYRGAVALIFPSLLEGFGLPIVEAMACGAPVITSNRSSMAEVAGGAAVLVDPEDVEAIAAAITRLMECPSERENLRRRGLARAAQFSWQRAARQTLDTFVEALAA